MHCRRLPLLAAAGLGVGAIVSGAAEAASVGCTPRSGHPVCRANYSAYPAGTLAQCQRSTGTAVVKRQSGELDLPRRRSGQFAYPAPVHLLRPL